jgi:hypothetical protein
MASTKRIKDKDGIFEEIDVTDYETYETHLNELTDVGYLVQQIDDDEDKTYYSAKEGLSWSDISRIDCQTKKQILLRLIDNPRTFFVLFNTQQGKLAIISKEMKSWASAKEKVVGFLIVSNDKSLADQTKEGLFDVIQEVGQVFVLSSNSKGVTKEIIKTHIDAYAADTVGDYKMPVVIALANNDQMKRVIWIKNHIKRVVETRASTLRYGTIFDEADDIYPRLRDNVYGIGGGVSLSLKNLLVDDDKAVYRLGFVTATEGPLLDEEYEECANAYMYPTPVVDPNYRAIHTVDSVIKAYPHRRQDSNDAYAETILAENEDYFNQPILLKNGTYGYRKTIVNGAGKTDVMEAFAMRRIGQNSYAMTVNMRGVTLYRPGFSPVRAPVKGVRFSKVLYDLYKTYNLNDKPIYIVGRRKIDRGLGFHHAPPGKDECLIWTDEILGRIDDKNNGSQKAGRLAGKVAGFPEYPGTLTWWTDKDTADMIIRHNKIVDAANSKPGCSVIQAVKRAEVDIPVVPRTENETVSHLEPPFATIEELCTRCKEIYDNLTPAPTNAYQKPRTPNKRNGIYVCSVGGESEKQMASTIIEMFGGTSTSNWGSGLTEANDGDFIKRVYPAYTADDRVVFFLRWAVKKA